MWFLTDKEPALVRPESPEAFTDPYLNVCPCAFHLRPQG